MDVQGARARGVSVTRPAIVLVGLLLWLLAPSTAGAAVRSEFFGIVQTATLDEQDIQGMAAARVRTNRFVLKWGWVQPTKGSFEWGPPDRFIGRLAHRGIRAAPAVWGNPAWVAGSGSTPPIGGTVAENAWRAFLRALVQRYGPGGSYWANGYRERVRGGSQAAADPVLADLERAQPAEVLRAGPIGGKYARLLQISHARDPQPSIGGPGSCSPGCPATGT